MRNRKLDGVLQRERLRAYWKGIDREDQRRDGAHVNTKTIAHWAPFEGTISASGKK
jgi:hypothetical protein